MKLTAKQERFAQAIVEGMNHTDAFRDAYGTAHKAKLNTIYRRAHEVLNNPKVSARIAELRERACKRHDVTVDSLTIELEEARALARETKTPAAMVSASMGKAKLHGHGVEKHEVGGPGGGPIPVSIDLSGVSSEALAELLKVFDESQSD